jgi:hypothetical protein
VGYLLNCQDINVNYKNKVTCFPILRFKVSSPGFLKNGLSALRYALDRGYHVIAELLISHPLVDINDADKVTWIQQQIVVL